MMLSSFPVSDNLSFSVPVEGHGVPDFSLVARRSQASGQRKHTHSAIGADHRDGTAGGEVDNALGDMSP